VKPFVGHDTGIPPEPGKGLPRRSRRDHNPYMDVTEEQHLDAVRAHLTQRYQVLDEHHVGEAIDTAHHRFDGCSIRDFVPLLVERAAIRALEESLAITPSDASPPGLGHPGRTHRS